MRTHKTFPAFTASAAEPRLIWNEVPNNPPVPQNEVKAKIDAQPQQPEVKLNGETTQKLDQAAQKQAKTKLDQTTQGLQKLAKQLPDGQQKITTQQQQQKLKSTPGGEQSANQKAESDILNDPQFQKREAAFGRTLRNTMGMSEEEAQDFQESVNGLPVSIRNMVYTVTPFLIALGIIKKPTQAAAPNYQNAGSGTPGERLSAQEKQARTTDESVKAARDSRQEGVLQSGETGPAAPTYDRERVQTAQKQVDSELKMIAGLLTPPLTEEQRKTLTEPQRKQLDGLTARQKQLQDTRTQLEGMAKQARAPETPESRFKRAEQLRGETATSVQAAEKSVVSVFLAPVFVDQGLVKTAQERVQTELKFIATPDQFPEANRKGLAARTAELQTISQQLQGYAKLLQNPQAQKKLDEDAKQKLEKDAKAEIKKEREDTEASAKSFNANPSRMADIAVSDSPMGTEGFVQLTLTPSGGMTLEQVSKVVLSQLPVQVVTVNRPNGPVVVRAVLRDQMERLMNVLVSPDAAKFRAEAEKKGKGEQMAKSEKLMKSYAENAVKALDDLQKQLATPEMQKTIKAMTPEQQKAAEQLVKQLPQLTKIASQRANGQPIGFSDSLVLMQAYSNAGRLAGPLQEPMQKAMKPIMELAMAGSAEAGIKSLFG